MAVTIKSKKEIEQMREAGKILEETHDPFGRDHQTGNFYFRD